MKKDRIEDVSPNSMTDAEIDVYVNRFADVMRQKLKANAHKGHWQRIPLPYLDGRLDEEHDELMDAIRFKESVEAVWKEAADVAALAMMIADNYETEHTE